MKKYLEYKDEKNHKFWQIEVEENSFTLKVGTVGTEPKIRFIKFSTEERALIQAKNMINKQISKGYKEMEEAQNLENNDNTSQTLENFKKKFAPYTLPKTLVEFIKFTDKYGNENFAESFYLKDKVDEDFYGLLSEIEEQKRKEYIAKMVIFAGTDALGVYAMWIQDNNADLEKAPIIFYSSEGEITIIAQNLKELIKILSFGVDVIYFGHYFDEDEEGNEDYDYYKTFLVQNPNFLKFRKWMQNTLNIKPVNIDDLIAGEEEYSEEVDALVEKAKEKYKKAFEKWQKKFYKTQQEIDREYIEKCEKEYYKTKKELLAQIAQKPTGDLYLKLAENEDLLEDLNHDQIDAYLENGLEIEPNNIEILQMYADQKFDDPKKAIELYSKLIEIHPKPETFYSNIASAYRSDKKNLKAIVFYRKDIIENPNSYSTFSQDYIVEICKELKSKDAITILEESLSHKINANTYLVLYKLYFNKKNYQKAVAYALNYIKHSNEQASDCVNIAERFFKKELYEEAKKLFEFCIENDFSKSKSYILLGSIYDKQGDKKEALSCFENALALDPEDDMIAKEVERLKKQ